MTEVTFNDGGFVRLVDKMESAVDLKVVNAARISMGKQIKDVGERDERLIRYLADHEHTTPFRHSYVTFHIKAPVFVLRQWMKHQVGCSWNEISGRYVEFNAEDVWTPDDLDWREGAENIKQGSAGPLSDALSKMATEAYMDAMGAAYEAYSGLLALGVAKEQARSVLPLSLMSECYWTASLQAVSHFLRLRLDSHAQAEIRNFATAVKTLVLENVAGAESVMEALHGST
jgi:thymidylate synthase (FAD)